MHLFRFAPDFAVSFESDEDREAARNFMDLLAVSQGEADE